MLRLLIISLLTLLYSYNVAQSVQFSYSLDECNVTEDNGLLPSGDMLGSFDCECGVDGNSLGFVNNEGILLPDTLSRIMENDFTLEFYFLNTGSTGVTDIFSIKNRCNLDSMVGIQYIDASNELILELAFEATGYKTLRTTLKANQCWHHVVLTKQELNYSFYVDGAFIGTLISDLVVKFGANAQPAFSNSPCLAVNHEPFVGRLDQIKIHSRALSQVEIQQIYLKPDHIITSDTTIFKGDNIDILVGPSCYDNFTWIPGTYLDNINTLDPNSTPDQSIVYYLSVQTESCIATDSVAIYVLDKNDLECDKLYLPKAFTPNNDGLNDEYGISNTFIIESLDFFEIYDRWGSKVFSTNQPSIKWDGNFEGTPVNPGMFLYKARYTCQNEEHVSIGNFSVIR
jgi:gliding motility-associated-like protein